MRMKTIRGEPRHLWKLDVEGTTFLLKAKIVDGPDALLNREVEIVLRIEQLLSPQWGMSGNVENLSCSIQKAINKPKADPQES